MFILGLIIITALLILLFTSTYTNIRVKKDIQSTENSININKILLDLMSLIDLIQINQTRLIRYAKDAIISKDELNIDRVKFDKIQTESRMLINNIEKLKKAYNENIEKGVIEYKKDYVLDIENIYKIANLLISKIRIELYKNIEKRHQTLTKIGDDFLRLEIFLNDISHDFSINLKSLESSFRRRLEANLKFSSDIINLYNSIDLVTRLQKIQNDLVLTAIASIGFSDKGYIDDKRITLINANLIELNKNIIELKTCLADD
jgi:hypothetical protein